MTFIRTILLTLLLIPALSHSKTITLTPENSVDIRQGIDVESVTRASQTLLEKCIKPDTELYLVLHSPGGSIKAGMDFINFVKQLPCKVHTVTMFSASMAYNIVQSLGTLYIIRHGTLMSHRGRTSIQGEIPGELPGFVDYLKDMLKILDEDISSRLNMDTEDYRKLISDELWLTAPKAIKMKHADEIADIKCSAELLEEIITIDIPAFFGVVEINFNGCPLITSPIKVDSEDKKVKDLIFKLFKFRKTI